MGIFDKGINVDGDLDRTIFGFICIRNTKRIYNDGSSDEADRLLTIGNLYYGFYSVDKKHIFIEKSDLGGFPTGHRWVDSINLKLLSDIRDDKLNELGI